MFPRRYYAGRYFAPRYFPESQGAAPTDTGPWATRRHRFARRAKLR